jgi:hypothetical protein
VSRRGASVVYVDASSFAAENGSVVPAVDVRAQIARLGHVGVPVSVVRKGDDLAERLGPAALGGEAVG